MLSYEEYARRVDEAVTRQWIRDNKNKLSLGSGYETTRIIWLGSTLALT